MRRNGSNSKRRRATAYHEAGHAVAALILNAIPTKVTIEPGQDYQGMVERRSFAGKLDEYGKPNARERLLIEKDVIILLAGEIAQRQYHARSVRSSHGRGDRVAALYFLEHVTHDPEALTHYSRFLARRATLLIKRHWYQVEALAQALLVEGTINGKRVRLICEDAMRRMIATRRAQRENADATSA